MVERMHGDVLRTGAIDNRRGKPKTKCLLHLDEGISLSRVVHAIFMQMVRAHI
jgi:hypothetical protein